MMSDFRIGRGFRRRQSSRQPKAKIVIFSEGQNTEPQYFRGLKAHFSYSLVEVEIYPAQGVPLTLVEAASTKFSELTKTAKKSGDSFDQNFEVWAVFDVDQHPNLNEAKAIAKAKKVKVACSNPCFEIWLVYHFEDFNRPIHRHELQSHAETLIPSYKQNAGKSVAFADLADKIEHAIEKAKVGLKNRSSEGKPDGNPSTNVYELVKSISRK